MVFIYVKDGPDTLFDTVLHTTILLLQIKFYTNIQFNDLTKNFSTLTLSTQWATCGPNRFKNYLSVWFPITCGLQRQTEKWKHVRDILCFAIHFPKKLIHLKCRAFLRLCRTYSRDFRRFSLYVSCPGSKTKKYCMTPKILSFEGISAYFAASPLISGIGRRRLLPWRPSRSPAFAARALVLLRASAALRFLRREVRCPLANATATLKTIKQCYSSCWSECKKFDVLQCI